MTADMADLISWIRVCLWIAAISTSAFPLLYLASPWYGSKLGRVVMFQAIAFAAAMDVTLLFQYWVPSNVMVIFWINAVVLSLIAVASTALTIFLWQVNYRHQKWVKYVFNLDAKASLKNRIKEIFKK